MLDLNELGGGIFPAISANLGMALAEAGGVCLESQNHVSGVRLSVRGYHKKDYSLTWPSITEQSRSTWNDDRAATEWGAVGVAVLLAKRGIGYAVLERSRRGTGFDYWMGNDASLPFRDMARLEISGIRQGNDAVVKARVRQKISQTRRSDGKLPAYVIVVEFGRPLAEVQKK